MSIQRANPTPPPPPVTVSLVVAWRVGKGYDFGKVQASANFAPMLRSIATKADARLTKLGKPKPYAIGDSLENDEYMSAPLARQARVIAELAGEAHALDAALGATARPHRGTAATTDDPSEFRRRLVTTLRMQNDINVGGLAKAVRTGLISFYAIVSGSTIEDRVAYIRHLNPVRLAKPGNFFARLGETLDQVTEPLFAFDDRVDLVIRPDDVLIFNKDFFESLFFDLSGDGADLDNVVERALSALPFVAETKAMVVERSRGRRRLRRKMLEIEHSGHLKHVTLEKFEGALEDHGIARDRFVKDGQVFSTEEDSELLLQILNEDLYEGALTGRRLAASRKTIQS